MSELTKASVRPAYNFRNLRSMACFRMYSGASLRDAGYNYNLSKDMIFFRFLFWLVFAIDELGNESSFI